MKRQLDPARILYAVGILFGIAAVLFFARDLVFELSITVRAALLFFAFIACLIGTVAVDRSEYVLGFAVLGAVAYLAFLVYTIPRFDIGSEGTFLALLVSASLFDALGYLFRERELAPSRTTIRFLVVGVILIAMLFIGADVLASGVAYDVNVTDAETIGDRGQVQLGTVTVANRFLFREPIDIPQAFACIYIPGAGDLPMRPHPVHYRVDGERVPDSVPGDATLQVSMTVQLTDDERGSIDGPLQVDRATECPDTSETARILVLFGDNRPLPPETNG